MDSERAWRSPTRKELTSMSKITRLAETSVGAFSAIIVELVEADETPAVVIVQWPLQPTVLHPRRFPETAAMIARLFATASTELASTKFRRRL
jgi:hypothetical protein